MATNKFLPFAAGDDANVMSDDDYANALATNGAFQKGVTTGQASSKQANKTWRQSSLMAAAIAQVIVDFGQDAHDALTPEQLAALIRSALLTQTTADARYVRGIWNTTTDQRILSIARNKTDSGIYVQLDNNTSQRLQLFGDYATNTALTAETNRAATVESNLQSSKVNRDGDTLTGTLNINVPGVGVLLSGNGGGDNVPGGISYAAGVQSSPSVGATPKAIYRFINVNGVGSFATIWLTGNDGSPHELRFGADDRLRTASGNVFALTSELPLPEGMHAQIFVTSIPAGTPCGPGQEGCLVTLPIAFSSIAVVQVCNSGQNVYTISGIGVGGSQVRLWVQSPQHLSGTLVEYVNVNLNVYGYR